MRRCDSDMNTSPVNNEANYLHLSAEYYQYLSSTLSNLPVTHRAKYLSIYPISLSTS
jgi:hypothetical protein